MLLQAIALPAARMLRPLTLTSGVWHAPRSRFRQDLRRKTPVGRLLIGENEIRTPAFCGVIHH